MKKKPANLAYSVDDRPPLSTILILGLQHSSIILMTMIIPVIVVTRMGNSISPITARSFISMTLIAAGLISILQSIRRGPVGSGYLCPSSCGPVYLSASIAAAAKGGLPLVYGMTLISGIVEAALAPVIERLRKVFTTEVTGVVVAMIGVVIIPLAIRRFFGITSSGGGLNLTDTLVGVASLGVMIGLNVWAKGKLRLFCVLVGMAVGYVLSYVTGILSPATLHRFSETTWFSLPRIEPFGWAFDYTMAIPFVIVTLCNSVKTVGDIGTCQKINDAGWNRPDMKNIAKGVLAGGLGGIIPGLIGGYGLSTSSSNVGLSVATGATSRVVAYAIGGIAIALAFFPRLAEVFLIMPAPVMGASLIFSISFMIVAGFQMVMSRMLDARRVFIVGVSIIFGIGVEAVPGTFVNVHPWLKPITGSALSLSAVMVILLNLILRIGIGKKRAIEVLIGPGAHDEVVTFMEKMGDAWAARREIVQKASAALIEWLESAELMDLSGEKAVITAIFDELSLDVTITYPGIAAEPPPGTPSPEKLESGDREAWLSMSDTLMRHFADKVSRSVGSNTTTLKLHFEH